MNSTVCWRWEAGSAGRGCQQVLPIRAILWPYLFRWLLGNTSMEIGDQYKQQMGNISGVSRGSPQGDLDTTPSFGLSRWEGLEHRWPKNSRHGAGGWREEASFPFHGNVVCKVPVEKTLGLCQETITTFVLSFYNKLWWSKRQLSLSIALLKTDHGREWGLFKGSASLPCSQAQRICAACFTLSKLMAWNKQKEG